MENVINKLVTEIKNNIAHDLRQYLYCNNNKNNGELLKLVLGAYNTYQEEERDGIAYISDINKAEDLKSCIEGGMTAQEVAWIYEQSQVNTTPFFYFGANYQKPKLIANYVELVDNLVIWLEDVLHCVLAYPYLLKSYEELYKVCITDYMINKQLVP